MFRKPLSTSFDFNQSNSVSLMGFVDQPIRVIDTEPDSFCVSTLLRVKDPRDPNRSFRIPLSIWDVMARKCIAHLKPNDFIPISGRLVSYDKSSSNENSSLVSLEVVREDGIEESKNGDIDLWKAFFANPDDWWDRRRSKKNPRLPDFKHKHTDEALWLSSDTTPVWVTRHLELLDQRRGEDDTEEPEHDEIHLWKFFFANPDEWWDKRRNKKSPKLPDFKHKDKLELYDQSLDQPTLSTTVTILPPPERIRQEIPGGSIGLGDDGGESAISEERVGGTRRRCIDGDESIQVLIRSDISRAHQVFDEMLISFY
ncbi:hypothetical protein Bca52824_002650 [Brassica carinata]|uniref:Uncharacterized protein n=1 Tax=Brassica carinata TaxID=52824 RepID=A0A8X7WMG8_BRACI|nr:hypothetical protein Bca52824_002650 [Brassica carinata]